MSLDLLTILGNKDNYERFKPFINTDILGQEVTQIVKDLKDYYLQDETITDVDWELFSDWFKIVQHTQYKSDKIAVFDKLFERLESYEESAILDAVIEQFISQDTCARIADIAIRGAEGETVDLRDISEAIERYDSELDKVNHLDKYVVTHDFEEMLEEVIEGGYDWRMKFLNQSIGRVRNGKLIVFAARPNTGKTTFLASEATHIASQLEDDEVVLWFNNEEAGTDVKMRIIQAAINREAEDIKADPALALAEYEKAVGHKARIVIVDKADLNTRDIEEYIKQYNVGLIIFDQLWKVHGFEKTSGTDTVRLGRIFQWGREIAKKYAPVITVHQVKTEGEGVEHLTLSQLYLSGTVIQGEADSVIMMGRNYKTGEEKRRFIDIVKNKGAYGPSVDNTLTEGKCEVEIIPHTAQFKEFT